MNILCSLYISGNKLGSIISIPRDTNLSEGLTSKSKSDSTVRIGNKDDILILSDVGQGARIDLQLLDKKVPDEPLRKLSSNDYVILTDKTAVIKDRMYSLAGTVPYLCRWKAIPMIKMDELVDVQSENDIDDLLLREGYAKELKNAACILMPPSLDEFSSSCTPYDLLVKKIEDTSSGYTIIPFSERKITIPKEQVTVEGRYLICEEMPKFSGQCRYPPFTYNMDTLVSKFEILQKRLHNYGSEKVESVCTSMNSIASKLRSLENQFIASSIYDDVVALLDKLRMME